MPVAFSQVTVEVKPEVPSKYWPLVDPLVDLTETSVYCTPVPPVSLALPVMAPAQLPALMVALLVGQLMTGAFGAAVPVTVNAAVVAAPVLPAASGWLARAV